MGRQALALLAILDAACVGADELEQAATEEFRKHPDHAVITSFPGLADLTAHGFLPRSVTTVPDSPTTAR
jgi:hypothetical protein